MLTWPFFIVLTYFFVDFARPQDWIPALRAFRPGVFALGGGLLTLFFWRHLLYVPTRAKLMLAFWAVMLIGTPFALNRGGAFSLTRDFSLFLFGAVLPFISFVDNYRRLRWFVSFFLLTHVLLALRVATNGGVGIIGSILGDENDVALAFNVAIPYAFFALYFVRRAQGRLVLVLALGMLLVGVTASMSRGGFLGLITVAVACWLWSPKRVTSAAIIVAISVPVLFTLVPKSYWKEMGTIRTSTNDDDTGAQRLYLWNVAWEIFKDHPVIGAGPAGYRYVSFLYESPAMTADGFHIWGRVAHSVPFTLIAETGIVGLVLFIAILVVGFRENHRLRLAYAVLRDTHGLSPPQLEQLHALAALTRANDAAMMAFLVTGAFLTVLYYPHFWLHVGVSIVMRRSADKIMAEGTQVKEPPSVPVTARGAALPA